MNLPSSLKARIVEILIELSPGERKVVIQELEEVVRLASLENGLSNSGPSNAPRSDSGLGLVFWN